MTSSLLLPDSLPSRRLVQAHVKYLECLRTVFGSGGAAPPPDAADALARGAKRLRAVIEVETLAGQALAASWAGRHAVAPHAVMSGPKNRLWTKSTMPRAMLCCLDMTCPGSGPDQRRSWLMYRTTRWRCHVSPCQATTTRSLQFTAKRRRLCRRQRSLADGEASSGASAWRGAAERPARGGRGGHGLRLVPEGGAPTKSRQPSLDTRSPASWATGLRRAPYTVSTRSQMLLLMRQ